MIHIKLLSTSLFIALLLIFTGTAAFAGAGTCTTATNPVSRAHEVPAEVILKKEKKINAKQKRLTVARIFHSDGGVLKTIKEILIFMVMGIGVLLCYLPFIMLFVVLSGIGPGLLMSLLIGLGGCLLGIIMVFIGLSYIMVKK